MDHYRLFLDIDTDSSWLWRTGPLWDDLLPLVRMEVHRLAGMFPLGDIAVIKRSDDGWFIRFNHAKLTKQEEEVAMIESKGHRGHVYFSCLIHDSTLRVSKKPRKNSYPPRLVKVIKLG